MSNLKDLGAADRDQALNDLFANVKADVDILADLPSKGRFYGAGFQGVRVSPLTFEDEFKILRNKGNDPINEILDRCIKGIKVSDLVIPDKLYLLMKVREISYGSEYKFSLACPKCKGTVDSTLDIDGMQITYAKEDAEDPVTIKLPKLGVIAKIKLPRVSDEAFLTSDEAPEHLYRFVVELKGESDPVFIAKAYKRMGIADKKAIAQALNKNNFGIDTLFFFECPSCKHTELMEIPFTGSFFSVS